jgi:chitodextrinase
LRLRVNSDGSVFGGEFHTTSTSWTEGTLTWDTQPAMDPAIVGTLGAASPNTTYDIDVTPAVTRDGLVAIEGVSTDGDGVHYVSKEATGTNAPRLIVSTTAAPADTTPPTAPTNLATTAVTATSVALAWTAATDDVGVDHYEVTRDGTALPSVTGTSVTDVGRSPVTLYHYSVVAVDAAGNRSPAALLDVTTAADTTKPSAPTGLATGAVTSTQVQLAWTASTDDVGVVKYRVYRDSGFLGESATTGYTDGTVLAGTTYTYTVSAVDAAGNESPPSAGLPVTTAAGPDTTPPTQPTGLAVGSVTASQVPLSWTASTDNVGVAKYRVYRNNGFLGESTTTAYTDSTVVASTPYTYTVSAVDAAGNESAQSAAVSVTTPAGGAVLFTDDFETGTLAQWTTNSATVVQSSLVYAGAWAARMTTTSTAAYLSEKLPSTYTELTVTARLMEISQGANNITLMKVRTGNAGSVLGVFITTSGRLSLRNDVAGITTSSTVPFTPNVWHEVKLHVIAGTTPLSEVWFDGVKVDALTKTDSLGANLLGWVDALDKAGSRTYDVAVDDFRITTP